MAEVSFNYMYITGIYILWKNRRCLTFEMPRERDFCSGNLGAAAATAIPSCKLEERESEREREGECIRERLDVA